MALREPFCECGQGSFLPPFLPSSPWRRQQGLLRGHVGDETTKRHAQFVHGVTISVFL
jgi:hypothetical protein